ncbi:MFS transporter [Pseudomonas typographi]|uniref:MFS transporter n=1 Tax=Pseudomonas typographi TaxID=2715964 RepID=A0ABR7Z1U0_9PSED|nr:MFS transporter [Pseudomonas typographi]MBD1551455.1 MFS transporter [Pseudomonas typographi]MBD1587559.1 MFS transporter [Pseudomonas typographi]MBD1599358.1 MFS transporter [Pseudomonas typographi]
MSTATPAERPSALKIALLGVLQILSWGGSFYLLGVLADPIVADTGWPRQGVLAGASLGLLVAGLLAPLCGRLIARIGGGTVLASHGFFLSAGLWLMAVAPSLPVFLLAWALIGAGMAGGLYDALFTSLGATHGLAARPIIVGVTLISGFCTTLMWPLLAVLAHTLGWRLTCGAYGVVLLAIYPLYRYALVAPPAAAAAHHARGHGHPALAPSIYWPMTLLFALAAALMTCISIVLLTVLQARGHSLASAIALGALIGPAQVLCRIGDLVFKRQAPMATALLSSGLTAVGLLVVDFAPAWVAWGLVCYGAGNGLRAIVKSTLPLVVVNPADYAEVSGRMARPALIAQALAPLACGYLIAHLGSEAMIDLMATLAILAFSLCLWLAWVVARAARARELQ